MSRGVRLRVWGDYACFTRPEMKVERVSYDVMTPSSARGILEAVYWKPALRWHVRRIHVIKPIKFTNIRRNEVADKIPVANALRARKGGEVELALFAEDSRQQRAAMVLQDVEYVIEADFSFTSEADNNPGKHLDQFNRRAAKGQCFHRPYLGCREFAAHFEPAPDDLPPSAYADETERRLGWMLHDIDFEADMQPRFFDAVMRGGVVEVPDWDGPEVRR